MCSSSSSSLSESGGESDTERHDSKKTVKKARHIETKEDLEKIRWEQLLKQKRLRPRRI